MDIEDSSAKDLSTKEENENAQQQGDDFNNEHSHDGVKGKKISKKNFQNIPFQYNSREFDNGSKATTATIDWQKGNVQYISLTGDTTLTFMNPFPGMRAILHIAGAFTPTFPGTCRFPGNTTPVATATAGNKDIYSVIYSGKEKLYDVVQSANFPIT